MRDKKTLTEKDMRRVKVWRYVKGVKLFDGEATFHQWGCDYEEFENGPGNFTTAVIERDDGTVETPPANWIAFLPNKEISCERSEA